MAEPFLSEIRIFSFNFPPKGWAYCDGQLLPISQNQALFALMGTTYGGDGRVNFGLPNLRGQVPIHTGSGFYLGETGGEATHTLSVSELPTHSHQPVASTTVANQTYPSGNLWAKGGSAAGYAPAANASMDAGTVTTTGGSQPHENRSPYLTLNFCIALQGIFPSQN